jgi:hypothetical protein
MKHRSLLIALCAVLCLIAGNLSVQAQTTNTPQADAKNDDEINLDTQLYLIVGTNQDVAESKLPASLDGVIRQLRATLPFKNYRLAATLINRVKNEGRLELTWIGGPFATAGAATAQTPSFSQFKVQMVRLVRNKDGEQLVQMQRFNFGARFPIQTIAAVAANGAMAPPAFSYESTGVSTDISMREAEPVIVGTLNVGPSGDAIILVVSAKRTQK